MQVIKLKDNIVIVDAGFPVSQLFANLGIYSLNERIIGNNRVIELSNFDRVILEAYIKESGTDGFNII